MDLFGDLPPASDKPEDKSTNGEQSVLA